MDSTQSKPSSFRLPFRFRFTLRTLLLLTLMLTPVFGWTGNAVYQRNVEAAELERFKAASGQNYAVRCGGELGASFSFS